MVAVLERGPLVAGESDMPTIRALDDLLSSGTLAEPSLIGPSGERLPLPPAVAALLGRVVRELARGNAVAVAPYRPELTTQQAADLLNVSRPFLIENLLEAGAIPFRRVGRHRRVRLSDVLAYRQERSQTRREALREMLQQAEEDGLYDMAHPFASTADHESDHDAPGSAAG
jgi:excisionase family DNA binding protein